MQSIDVKLEYPRSWKKLLPILESEFAETLERAAEGQLAAYGRQYVLDDAMASGRTAQSFDISAVARRGDRMSINIVPTGDRAQIVSFIEYGRRPGGMPPREAIIEWMEDRGIIARGERNTKVSALSYAIAKKIGQDGIDPRFILEKARRHYRPYIDRMFQAAAKRAARKIEAILSVDAEA